MSRIRAAYLIVLLVVLAVSCRSSPQRRDMATDVEKLEAAETKLALPPDTLLMVRVQPAKLDAAWPSLRMRLGPWARGLPASAPPISALLAGLLRAELRLDSDLLERDGPNLDAVDAERAILWTISGAGHEELIRRVRMGLPIDRASQLPRGLVGRVFLPTKAPGRLQEQLDAYCAAAENNCAAVATTAVVVDYLQIDLYYHYGGVSPEKMAVRYRELTSAAAGERSFARDTPALRTFLGEDVAAGAYARTDGLFELVMLTEALRTNAALRHVGPVLAPDVLDAFEQRADTLAEISEFGPPEFEDLAVALEQTGDALRLSTAGTFTHRGARVAETLHSNVELPAIAVEHPVFAIDWAMDLSSFGSGKAAHSRRPSANTLLALAAAPYALLRDDPYRLLSDFRDLDLQEVFGGRARLDVSAQPDSPLGIRFQGGVALALRGGSKVRERLEWLVGQLNQLPDWHIEEKIVERDGYQEIRFAINAKATIFGAREPIQGGIARINGAQIDSRLHGVDSRLLEPEIRELLGELGHVEMGIDLADKGQLLSLAVGPSWPKQAMLPRARAEVRSVQPVAGCLETVRRVGRSTPRRVKTIEAVIAEVDKARESCPGSAEDLGWLDEQWHVALGVANAAAMHWSEARAALEPVCAAEMTQLCAQLEQYVQWHSPVEVPRPFGLVDLATAGMSELATTRTVVKQGKVPDRFVAIRGRQSEPASAVIRALQFDNEKTELSQPVFMLSRRGLQLGAGEMVAMDALVAASRGEDEKTGARVEDALRVALLEDSGEAAMSTVVVAPDEFVPTGVVAWLSRLAWSKSLPKQTIRRLALSREPIPEQNTQLVTLLVGASAGRVGYLPLGHSAATPAAQEKEGSDPSNQVTVTLTSAGFSLRMGPTTLAPLEGCPNSDATICAKKSAGEIERRLAKLARVATSGDSDAADRLRDQILDAYRFNALYNELVELARRHPTTKLRLVVDPQLPFFVTAHAMSAVWARLEQDRYPSNQAFWEAAPTDKPLFPDIALDVRAALAKE